MQNNQIIERRGTNLKGKNSAQWNPPETNLICFNGLVRCGTDKLNFFMIVVDETKERLA